MYTSQYFAIIVLCGGLVPIPYQATTSTNADFLSIWYSATNLGEIQIKM